MTDSDPVELRDGTTPEGVFHAVHNGYQAVYDALGRGDTFSRIWRDNAYRGEFPIEFAHIGFLALAEARRLLELRAIPTGGVLVDLACGAGGPGLWAARQSGATLIGIDPAESGLEQARRRAVATGLADRATFRRGTFERTGLGTGEADAVMTIEALQYAPDKRAALVEFARVLKAGGRVGIVCFEVDPAKVAGTPVLGVDPVPHYTQLLSDAGFAIDAYEETPGWSDRVYSTFSKLVDASEALNTEMGERAAAGTLAEAMLTVALHPYPRRVSIAAHKT